MPLVEGEADHEDIDDGEEEIQDCVGPLGHLDDLIDHKADKDRDSQRIGPDPSCDEADDYHGLDRPMAEEEPRKESLRVRGYPGLDAAYVDKVVAPKPLEPGPASEADGEAPQSVDRKGEKDGADDELGEHVHGLEDDPDYEDSVKGGVTAV